MIGAGETDVIFCDAALSTNTAVEDTYLGRLSSLRHFSVEATEELSPMSR
jgi:hypothetical protein